jgi:predicted metal-dependent HD superfamily phosphohydrolase
MDARLPAALAQRLSFDCPAHFLERLATRYAEPHRRYHTWAHVVACFEARDRIASAALPEVDLALLFHDAVYVPLAPDNEDRSADLLVEEGRRAWLDERLLQRGRELIAATRHDWASSADGDGIEACVVADADLAILGSDRETFDEYERQVRLEFALLDDDTYAAGRSRVLRGLLARPTIFATRPGQRLWEAHARRNLADSLATLER